MQAMVFQGVGRGLQLEQRPTPEPGADEVLIRVSACGVCRTDLHIVEGDLRDAKPDLIPGHEIVGTVESIGSDVADLKVGDRVGVPWLGSSCGHCKYCDQSRENLCDSARFTGYQIDGGYAEFAVAHQLACYPLPDNYSDTEIAPLLCAGLIGYRSYRMAQPCHRLGLYGFGAAAHIICQLATQQGIEVYAFTREGDTAAQQLALELGAVWAGASGTAPPQELDSAIIFAAFGSLVPLALSQVGKGGKVVCAGIHMTTIPAFNYRILWGERSVCSVANLTRADGVEFLRLASEYPIQTRTTVFALAQANEALELMAKGQLTGAAVLEIPGDYDYSDTSSGS